MAFQPYYITCSENEFAENLNFLKKLKTEFQCSQVRDQSVNDICKQHDESEIVLLMKS